MKINFKRLYGRNFGSYEEFSLPIEVGKHLVSGPNGVGKSTPFESLVWTRYKKSLRDKDPSRDQKGNCMTGIDFNVLNQDYKIERFWKDDKRFNSIDLFVGEDNVEHRKKGSTEEEIEKLMSTPYDLFIASTVVLQGLPINIASLTPTIRKTIVEDMVGFTVWSSFKGKFGKSHKESQLERNSKKVDFQEQKEIMIAQNTELTTLKDQKGLDVKGKTEEIFSLKEQIPEKFESGREVRAKLDALLEGNTIESISDQINSLKSSLTIMSNRKITLDKILMDKICTECKQEYPESLLSGAIGELDSLSAKSDEIEGMVEDLSSRKINSMEFEKAAEEIEREITKIQEQVTYICKQIESSNSDDRISELEVSFPETQATANALNEELSELEIEVSNLKYFHDLMLPSSKFRTYVLEKYIDYINSLISSITPMIFDGVTVELGIDTAGKGIDIIIHHGAKKRGYKSFSGGEKRRIDVIIVLAFQRFLIESSGMTSNLLVFDEIFDGLDVQGIEGVLNSLDVIFPESSSIYVISHNESIKSVFSSVITPKKENDISYLRNINE